MTRFIGICTLLAITHTAAFSSAPQTPRALSATSRKAVSDDFDAPVLANPQYGTAVLTSEPIVDDECYTGKNGDFGACADFDPPRKTRTRSMNAMDRDRVTPKWTVADDFDAPVLANPQYGTAVLASEPVVDDECYMGKDGDLGACADFDPPRKTRTRSMNAMDRDRVTPKWTVADDFDAPVLANPQYGTAVLASEPIVDDECYMGKDGDLGACADFDPPKRENLWTNYQDKPRGDRKGLSRFL